VLTTAGHNALREGVPTITSHSKMLWHECEIAPELTGQGLALRKCEAYDRPYDQHHGPC
jgi:hypothetical protein